jgi:hypothetical protein
MSIRAFASHNWGSDGQTHRRVAQVVEMLSARGVCVWFDDRNMKGNILSAMCDGMDASQVILVFVTRAYVDKVRAGKETDNVRREFMYASRTPEKLVPILFESLSAPWSGPVAMVLGTYLYHDMAAGATERNVDELVQIIHRRNGKIMWHRAALRAKTTCLSRAGRPAEPQSRPTARTPTVKARVRRAVEAYGPVAGERTNDIVNSLFDSIVGAPRGEGMALEERLRLVEMHLGL